MGPRHSSSLVRSNRQSPAVDSISFLYRDILKQSDACAIREAFDVVIMSDLLHFDRSHDVLIRSLTSLLQKDPTSRAYVAAGKYTQAHVCDHFVEEARRAGIELEEGEVEGVWRGTLEVSGGGLDREQLGVRKNMCRWWVGRWIDSKLE